MKASLKLPLFGMNMEEATVSRRSKRAGDAFVKGEALYEIETEKVGGIATSAHAHDPRINFSIQFSYPAYVTTVNFLANVEVSFNVSGGCW